MKFIRKTFVYKFLHKRYKLFKSKKIAEFDKRVLIITGVAKGLGYYLVNKFDSNYFKIIGIDRVEKQELPVFVQDKLFTYHQYDLSHLNDIKLLVENIAKETNRKIDILVNNAAQLTFEYISNLEQSEISNVFNSNLVAPILLSKYASKYMYENNYGRIINVSSNSAFLSYERGGVYGPAKAGLGNFTDAFSSEINNYLKTHKITINSIYPGGINLSEKYNPSVLEPSFQIEPISVYKKTLKIINSNMNGYHFAILSFNQRLFYLLDFINKIF